MRFQGIVTAGLALALASCATDRAPVRIVSSPTGGHCAYLNSHLRPEEVRPQLLFSCAEATLASGHRYFRLTAYSESSPPIPSLSTEARMERQGRLCFDLLAGPDSHESTYDSVQVVRQASPALRQSLSPAAGKALAKAEDSRLSPNPQGRPGGEDGPPATSP